MHTCESCLTTWAPLRNRLFTRTKPQPMSSLLLAESDASYTYTAVLGADHDGPRSRAVRFLVLIKRSNCAEKGARLIGVRSTRPPIEAAQPRSFVRSIPRSLFFPP